MIKKEKFEKLLQKFKKRKDVALKLGCSATYVSKLVAKHNLRHRAFWITKRENNV